MPEAYIYDHVRSPRGRGRPNGALHEVTSLELATQVLKNIRERSDLDTTKVEDVILGCVMPVGEQGADIARIAALNADYAETTAGVQINRFCSSGLEAVNMAAAKVAAGEADLAIGGGVEMMSRVPLSSDGGAWPTDPTSAFKTYFVPQGISADLIATKWGFSRSDVDAYAVESQKRAANAWSRGYFKNSVFAVKDILGATLLDKDEHMRPETTMQTLAGLDPAFTAIGFMGGFDAVAIQRYPEIEAINHVHTAGNSSGIVDGAAGVLVGSKKMARGIGKSPRARIRATASIGSEPTIMLTGPEWVAQKVLKKAGMDKSDIDLWELNEAFASVVLRFMQALDVPHEKLNVN
ncbi:MAG: acetyl-CoA C-acetyltransferase, partial [Alphaproteobacteria bacterium]